MLRKRILCPQQMTRRTIHKLLWWCVCTCFVPSVISAEGNLMQCSSKRCLYGNWCLISLVSHELPVGIQLNFAGGGPGPLDPRVCWLISTSLVLINVFSLIAIRPVWWESWSIHPSIESKDYTDMDNRPDIFAYNWECWILPWEYPWSRECLKTVKQQGYTPKRIEYKKHQLWTRTTSRWQPPTCHPLVLEPFGLSGESAHKFLN